MTPKPPHSKAAAPPTKGQFLGFDHIHFWVGNAPQAAAYYVTRFGFEPYAYRGLETGSREITTYVIRQNHITFAFSSSLTSNPTNEHYNIPQFISKHGDGVKELCFLVDNCQQIYETAIKNGAKIIQPIQTIHDHHPEQNGKIIMATIQADWGQSTHQNHQNQPHNHHRQTNNHPHPPPSESSWHTFIERTQYTGHFLPGYQPMDEHLCDPLIGIFQPPNFQAIDHCVINVQDGKMNQVVNWYIKLFNFHRFWSVDDKQLHTKYSSLRSVVVSDSTETIKIPINEPALGLKKSQIQEFIDYFNGPGIQHIALNTLNILSTISVLKKRGVSFIKIPETYYDDLKNRLKSANINIEQDLKQLQELGILVDFDQNGYLLQTFTKPLQDRPTLFIEVIQRCNHSGFGVGNFKSLFEAIEREQALRGNL